MRSASSSRASSMESRPDDSFELDMESAERRVWLVKLPDFVFNRIADMEPEEEDENGFDDEDEGEGMRRSGSQGEAGREIGTVRIYPPSGDTPARVVVHLDEDGPCGDLPREYELKFGRLPPSTHIHMLAEREPTLSSRSSEPSASGGPCAIEGRVEQECHLRPMLTGDYRQVLQSRQQVLNRPQRSVQFVDAFSGPTLHLGLPKYVNETVLVDKWKRRTGVDPATRRDRLPQEDLLNVLFHLFERQPHWSLNALLEHTKQPVQFLKETLQQIAIYNVRGPNKNLYELKAEYLRR